LRRVRGFGQFGSHVTDGHPVKADARGAAATAEPLLEVRGLTARYGDAGGALEDVALDVGRGQVVAVLGSNGAGKSTLLRAISGMLPLEGGRIAAGSIRFAGRDLVGLGPAEVVGAGIVQVPEGRQIFGDLTVEENLRAGGLSRRDRGARRAARDHAYELFPRLAERRTQRAGLLSGGEQQMLAIGRALMAEPQLLLLDEPSLGLAPQVVEQIAGIVQEINRRGTTVVLVEQNAGMALRIAERAIVLEVGRVALEGPAAELATSDEVQERYLGVTREDAGAPAARTAARTRGASGAKPLRVEDLTVRFGGITALSEVSFEVEPGATHAIIGPNGAGKSTCLNVLTGVYRATSGTVRYGDTPLTGRRPHQIAALGVSRTFQNLALSPEATVEENLLLGRHRLSKAGFVAAAFALPPVRRERAAQLARVREVAAQLGISEHLHKPVHVLPYGDRKRVELARAVCGEPDLLLLDEPVAGMHGAESQQMAEVIRTVRDELGLSIVLVEHDMAFVMGLADRVTVLDFGRRIADGTPAEVQRDPEVLRAYLGAAGDATPVQEEPAP
jgi:ABC-type branched-subunit amino acid transport system ATPase component